MKRSNWRFVLVTAIIMALSWLGRECARRSRAKRPTISATVRPIKKPARLAVEALSRLKPPPMPLQPTKNGPLSSTIVVLDAGHGGPDPGCGWRETFGPKRQQTVQYWEAAYTYPVVGRLSERLRAKGATVYLTVQSKCLAQKEQPAQTALSLPRDAVFVATGEPVTTHWCGRSPRLVVADGVVKRYARSAKRLLRCPSTSTP